MKHAYTYTHAYFRLSCLQLQVIAGGFRPFPSSDGGSAFYVSAPLDQEDFEHVTFKNWKLHHVNLQAADVRKSVKFIATNLGLKEGSWRAPDGKGDFSINPKDLSVFSLGAFNGGLHIIKPDPGFALRNNFAHNPSIGGHPAIVVQDIQEVKNRLEAEDVLITDAGTYAMVDMHQIYCLDPSGNVIEVNQYKPN